MDAALTAVIHNSTHGVAAPERRRRSAVGSPLAIASTTMLLSVVACWAFLTIGTSASPIPVPNGGDQQRQRSISEQFLPCSSDSLVLYRVELTTKWTRDSFPKHYPEWRPPAQWTKFVGRSHDDSFTLFRMGEQASEGMRNFAESGRSEQLDEHAQGKDGILDSFAGPAITQGAGKSKAEFFADANHTLVSLASRLVPSPDWIIGMDSLNLCVDGRWADILSVELDPLDVGTDKGFTFTSPNWPQEPPLPISVLSPTSPDHPASSFHYPGIAELPKIASLHVIKVQEYKLMTPGSSAVPSRRQSPHQQQPSSSDLEVVSVSVKDNDVTYETVKSTSVHLPSSHQHPRQQTTMAQHGGDRSSSNPILVSKDDGGDVPAVSSGVGGDGETSSATTAGGNDGPGTGMTPPVDTKQPLAATDDGRTRATPTNSNGKQQRTDSNVVDDDDYDSNGNAADSNYVDDASGLNDANSLNAIDLATVNNLDSKSPMDLLELYAKKKRLNLKRKMRRHRPKNCVVSEWGPWRPCSKTCGIGETVRTRTVLRHAKRGGRPCPTLEERKWCGSQRDCNYKYFNWGSKTLA